jgi:hypothetical protein
MSDKTLFLSSMSMGELQAHFTSQAFLWIRASDTPLLIAKIIFPLGFHHGYQAATSR